MAEIVSLPKRPEKSNRDKMVDALFQVLPAHSHQEIARKMSKELGRRIKEWEIGAILLHLRINAQHYGWTVPAAQRGTKGKDGKTRPRFFHVLVDKARDPEFDAGHEAELNNGLISTVSHASTALQNQSEALMLAASYCPSIAAQKWVRSLGRRTKQIAEDATEILEMVTEENGGSAA
jgi:hypothetical protein